MSGLSAAIASAVREHTMARPDGETATWCVCLCWSKDWGGRAEDERAYEAHLAAAIERIAVAHAEAAVEAFRAEAVAAIERANLFLCDCGHSQGGEHNSLGCYGTVDYGLLSQRACRCRRTDDENPVNVNAAAIVRDLNTT